LGCAHEQCNEIWSHQLSNGWKYIFMYLNSFVPNGTKKLLMVTPHMTPWDTGIYQEWVLMFHLDFPHGLKILFWCSLKVLPFEYRPIDKTMSFCVGKIMGKDPNNHKRWDPRFCIMMNLKHGWVLTISIMGWVEKR
jgi:hypothetical protein